MADIFISYKKEDAGRVVRIVEGLRKEGQELLALINTLPAA